MRSSFSLLLLSILVLGCDDSTGPAREDPGVEPEWVTGPAAQALDASGRFIFAPLPPAEGELSRDEAVAIANAYFITLRTSVGDLRDALEKQHRGPIDFAALTMCGRIIPIAAPFLPTPLRPEAQYAHNLIAARYAFEFCEANGDRAVGLEASIAAGVTIADDGTLRYPDAPIIYGNEFLSFGIPLRLQPIRGGVIHGLWQLSPEAAVRAVYSRVRTPIQSVPQATGCLWWVIPCEVHMARHWRMETAEPVPIRREGATADELAQVFYVQVGYGARAHGGVYVPSREQPPPAYEVVDFMQQHTVIDSILLTLAVPLAMDAFTVAGPLH